MPRSQAIADSLTKQLDQSSRPIYVVDAQRRIVYCNSALSAWIDLEPKRIVGRRVEFHSEEPDTNNAVRRDTAPLTDLCPPPHALAGNAGYGTISCLARDGRLLHRAADFVPLGRAPKAQLPRGQQSSQQVAVLVLLASEDLSPQEVAAEVASDPTSDDLHRTIRRFRHRQGQRYSIQSLLGTSAAMEKVRAQVEAAAASGANTLIYGHRGSGRSHVALAIHYRGADDNDASLFPVDCQTLTDDMIERTLNKLRPSRTADARPTLLLENLECMSASHQLLLLAAIRQNSIDARVIATSGPRRAPDEFEGSGLDAKDTAEGGEGEANGIRSIPAKLDPALIGAISTISIRVPRLVERLEDLPLLAQFSLEACNRNNGKQVGAIRPDALDSLALYSWPGELDQLHETIAAAHAGCTSHEITAADLPPTFFHAFRSATHVRRQPERIVLDELLASIEKEAIMRALALAGGNKSEAAMLLGMTRPRLYRRLVQLGLAGDESDAVEPTESPEFIEQDAAE